MFDFVSDARFGIRSLLQRPAFTAVIIVTLALGIGANTAVFSIIDALVLRPFPIPDIDRLVQLYETQPNRGIDRSNTSPGNFLDWQREIQSLRPLAGFYFADFNLTGGDRPERAVGAAVTPGFLPLVGVEAAHGRTLASLEDDPSQAHTVVLGDRLWRERFGARTDVIGEAVLIDGREHTIVGVAPAGFSYPMGAEMWLPLGFTPAQSLNRSSRYVNVIGRLVDGVTMQQCRQELGRLAERLAQQHPIDNQGRGIRALELASAVVDIGAPAFLAVWQATVLVVLLIACVNIANLMLTRGQDRRRELSLRAALGAGRGRIIRQLMTENLLLATLGAAASLPLAWVALQQLRDSLPASVRRFVVGWDQISLKPETLLFTGLVAVAAMLLFGLLPALSSTRLRLGSILSEGSRTGEGLGHGRIRRMMIVVQVAMALTLLVAALLSVEGSIRQIRDPRGYQTRGILTFETQLPAQKYAQSEQRRRFFEDVLARIRTLPGVESADTTNILPASGNDTSSTVVLEGQQMLPDSERPSIRYRSISAGLLDTMGIPLLRGRRFDERDTADGSQVVIVSELAAERLWPGQDPLGRRLQFAGDPQQQQPWVTVVGVCGDVVHHWFDQGARPTLYRPATQQRSLQLTFAVKAGGDPMALMPSIRDEISAVDPDQPVFNVASMEQVVSDNTVGLQYMAVMMAVFGVLALLLSVVGIYGLTSYAVSRRTRELGVRAALGAGRRDLLQLTVGGVMRLTAVGVVIGLAAAWGVGQLLVANLFGTVQLNILTYAGVAVLLGLVSGLAGLIPSLQAVGREPASALRED